MNRMLSRSFRLNATITSITVTLDWQCICREVDFTRKVHSTRKVRATTDSQALDALVP